MQRHAAEPANCRRLQTGSNEVSRDLLTDPPQSRPSGLPRGALENDTMTDIDDIREQQERSADTYSTALKIRELLEALETDWGEEAAARALAIVTGEET